MIHLHLVKVGDKHQTNYTNKVPCWETCVYHPANPPAYSDARAPHKLSPKLRFAEPAPKPGFKIPMQQRMELAARRLAHPPHPVCHGPIKLTLKLPRLKNGSHLPSRQRTQTNEP